MISSAYYKDILKGVVVTGPWGVGGDTEVEFD